jgi:hypothetical protein
MKDIKVLVEQEFEFGIPPSSDAENLEYKTTATMGDGSPL